jgi:DNA modification methylase
MEYKLYEGDNILSLKKLEDNSIDSVVTDPPYGLSFMNKKWDYDVPSVEFWKELYRVLKPGGHVLSFGGTRTYHRMTVNIEDAGFEIRDQIMWLYGSGFPKSHNIGKAVDKLQGNEGKEIIDEKWLKKYPNGPKGNTGEGVSFNGKGLGRRDDVIKKYISENDWEGWGTALKPANEPICVARKPLSEKSVALNVLKWGTGGINIDGCRIGSETIMTNMKNTKGGLYNLGNEDRTNEVENTFNEGRFPANIILECLCDEVIKGEKGEPRIGRKGGLNESEFSRAISPNPEHISKWPNDKGDIHTNPDCPCYIMDNQSGVSKSQNGTTKTKITNKEANWFRNSGGDEEQRWGFGDKGGASRFFYQAKVSKAERNLGLDHFEDKTIHDDKNKYGLDKFNTLPKKNNHPTVKPVNLMTYLCRLITPPNGIVLDPFVGSGSTGIAALLEGFDFIGMDLDTDYIKIADSRIKNYEEYRKFHEPNKII